MAAASTASTSASAPSSVSPPAMQAIKAIDRAPRRSPALHWAALAAAVVSLTLLAAWMAQPSAPVPQGWLLLDAALGVFFAAELFTRSGFRWEGPRYLAVHFFDFLAMVPALALVQHGLPGEGVWVWLVLLARAARAVNRALGDGFVKRNALALVEGFEEELTDRVTLRILARIEADLARGRFGHAVGQALARNKAPMLERVRASLALEGAAGEVARVTGIEAALAHAQERAFDAVVEVVSSQELDDAIRDVLDETFGSLRREIGVKSWRHQLGLHPKPAPPRMP